MTTPARVALAQTNALLPELMHLEMKTLDRTFAFQKIRLQQRLRFPARAIDRCKLALRIDQPAELGSAPHPESGGLTKQRTSRTCGDCGWGSPLRLLKSTENARQCSSRRPLENSSETIDLLPVNTEDRNVFVQLVNQRACAQGVIGVGKMLF